MNRSASSALSQAKKNNDPSRRAASPKVALSEFEQVQMARDVIAGQAKELQRLSKNIPADFQDVCETVFRCRGSVIVTGMGKAGWIGQKISASFASTGTSSHFLHPAEAIHGDLGRVSRKDMVLVFSNSGETEEVLHLLPTFGKLQVPVVAITGKTTSTLADHSTFVLDYGRVTEAGHLGLAPSTSTTMMLAMGDALVLVVSRMKQFTANDFARFHPGGALGKKLSAVEEIMRPLEVCRVAQESETVRDVYLRFNGQTRRTGAILVIGSEGRLSGIFTDSDLARLLERKKENQFDRPIRDAMTRTPVTISCGERTTTAVETLACRNLSELPVIDRQGAPIGLIDITDVISFIPS